MRIVSLLYFTLTLAVFASILIQLPLGFIYLKISTSHFTAISETLVNNFSLHDLINKDGHNVVHAGYTEFIDLGEEV